MAPRHTANQRCQPRTPPRPAAPHDVGIVHNSTTCFFCPEHLGLTRVLLILLHTYPSPPGTGARVRSTLTRARLINLEWRPPWPMRPESLCCRPIRVQDVHICSRIHSRTLMVRQRDGLYICVAVLRRWPQTSTARQSMRNMSLTQGTTYLVRHNAPLKPC